MPRRKPASAKQRKAELQLKRAVKRGDIEPPEKERNPRHRTKSHRSLAATVITGSALSSKRLASAFAKLSPEFLAKSKDLAYNEPLPRPLPFSAALFPIHEINDLAASQLTCPKRPKWRFEMEKKEVEKNEEGVFAKWLADTDKIVDNWRHTSSPLVTPSPTSDLDSELDGETERIERSPTYFERNLEVWRQLWRVVEISQIILVLLDSRCPPVHYPPSLHEYLTALKPVRKIILVLTKVDVVGLERARSWSRWLRDRYGSDIRIVKTSSYIDAPHGDQVQGRTRLPSLPSDFRADLMAAIKECHTELCTPPDSIKDSEEKLKQWKPKVVGTVDWNIDSAHRLSPTPGNVASSDNLVDSIHSNEPDARASNDTAQDYLTICLVGQPNVGKSSLLNALFGTHKAKASRTPGKTKHFQTLYLTPQIRLVDCPGLVFPAFIPMELQVLSATLPISQIPSIPSCLHFASSHIPLEDLLKLTHPTPSAEKLEDKRTWRGERSTIGDSTHTAQTTRWTTMDILIAYALRNGWITAKAGRPDVNRAGNALLRLLAEAKIPWGFLPPDFNIENSEGLHYSEGKGIWLHEHRNGFDDRIQDTRDVCSSDGSIAYSEDELDTELSDEEEVGEGEVASDEDVDASVETISSGRFGALTIVDEDA